MLLLNGDAIEEMKKLDDNSIDMFFCDLPYGITNNKWDTVIPLESLWKELKRIVKTGGNMVFTTSQPFTSALVSSNYKQYKYEVMWYKSIGSGQLNVNIMPLKRHETIQVFRNGGNKSNLTYNEILGEGVPYKINRDIRTKDCYGTQEKHSSVNTGTRRMTSVWEISNPRIKGGHPTEKPLELMERIISVYSNENDVVLDCCMGSGVTGEACVKLNRNFIGIELDENYFKKAKKRIDIL